MDPCDAATEANQLLDSLTTGLTFELPVIDLSGGEFSFPGGVESPLYQVVTKLTNEDLATGTLDGTGTFETLMRGIDAHLTREYEKNRITGAEYAKVYSELTIAAMQTASQYLVAKEQTFWAAITGQMQAIAARASIEVEKARVVTARFEANNMRANYALTKIKLATEEKTYCVADFNLNQMLPMQLKLLTEQAEAARAQTIDTRMDGTTLVAGVIGVQKDLQNQQIVSYKRDAETKAAKIFSDAWTVQKTIDEGLSAPVGFTNASLDEVLTAIKTNNGLD